MAGPETGGGPETPCGPDAQYAQAHNAHRHTMRTGTQCGADAKRCGPSCTAAPARPVEPLNRQRWDARRFSDMERLAAALLPPRRAHYSQFQSILLLKKCPCSMAFSHCERVFSMAIRSAGPCRCRCVPATRAGRPAMSTGVCAGLPCPKRVHPPARERPQDQKYPAP